MPVNGMNTGRDFSFGVYDQNIGVIVDFGDIQYFEIDAHKANIVSRPYNGLPKFGYVPDGYAGTFQIVRTKADVEQLQIKLSALFNTGGSVLPGFINYTVNNPDGSVARYQVTGAVFWMNKIASGSREKTIDQTVEWLGSDNVLVA
jgi:hypothetical protein